MTEIEEKLKDEMIEEFVRGTVVLLVELEERLKDERPGLLK